jgi:hypothetical protein
MNPNADVIYLIFCIDNVLSFPTTILEPIKLPNIIVNKRIIPSE